MFSVRPFATAFLCLLGGVVFGQVPQIAAVRCEHPPKLDGNLSDPAWLASPVATHFLDRFSNSPTEDATEARIVYDDEAIYVAFYCHDIRPEEIVAREIEPESRFNGEDTVSFDIDPFNTRSGSSLSKFTVNAINTGTESIAGGHASKVEWRGLWQSFVKRKPDGYIVQMRIPWKILSYPKATKAISMDLNFERYQARTKINSQWANVTQNFKPELLGIWTGVVPPASDSRAKTQFLAYGAPTFSDGKFSMRGGLDVRHAVSNQLTALLSISPDFVNIEQQIAGVSFAHTERFLSDARPFFTEGNGFYQPVGEFEYGQPFYSQRIGEINVGGKFYGQLNAKTQIGVLAAEQSDGSIAAFGNYSKNYTPTFFHSIYGSSFDGNGLHDHLIGTKIGNRWGSVFVDGDVALEDNGMSRETAGNFEVGYQSPKLFTILQQQWVDPSFNPLLAYIPWQNRRGGYLFVDHNDRPKKGPIHDFDISIFMPDFHMSNGKPQERGFSAEFFATTRNDQSLSLNRSVMDYETGSDDFYNVGYGFNSSNRFKQIGFNYLFGRQNGERSRFLDIHGSLRVLKKIDLGFEQSILVFPGSDARQTIATIGWELDKHRSVTGRFVQTNSEGNFFLSFRNSGGSGIETYVILGDPNSTTFQKKLSFKFVVPF